MQSDKELRNVTAALEGLDLSLDLIGQSLSGQDGQLGSSSQYQELRNAYDTMLNAHGILYRHKRRLDLHGVPPINSTRFIAPAHNTEFSTGN